MELELQEGILYFCAFIYLKYIIICNKIGRAHV